MWEMWDKIGMKPYFISVPGNHDLVRPPTNDPRMILLTEWNKRPEVVTEFWSNKSNQYIDLVNKALSNYQEWFSNLNNLKIPVPTHTGGLITGDLSCSLEINNISVGIIGLNSSFIQLNGEDFKERLVLSSKQLNAVTNDDPPAWSKNHDLNFLVTHHPPSWLNSESVKEYNSEINPRVNDNSL